MLQSHLEHNNTYRFLHARARKKTSFVLQRAKLIVHKLYAIDFGGCIRHHVHSHRMS